MLEGSNAEMSVGPSMADGSHGCRPNWADFPVAARRSLISGKLVFSIFSIKICGSSQELL